MAVLRRDGAGVGGPSPSRALAPYLASGFGAGQEDRMLLVWGRSRVSRPRNSIAAGLCLLSISSTLSEAKITA